MDSEAVSKHEHIAFLEIRLYILLIHSGLLLVVDQDHDHVGDLGGLGGGHDG